MATIFKSLAPSDYTITPFPAYYEYSYVYTSGSSGNSSDVNVLYGRKYPLQSIAARTPSAEYELYDSIVQSFYSSSAYASYGLKTTSYVPSQSLYVVSITQHVYGNTVVPGTFKLIVDSTSSIDDGKGNIIVSSSGTGSNIGVIFYDKGIAVINPLEAVTATLNTNGMYIAENDSVTIEFTSTVMIYEHSIRLKIAPKEFTYSWNNPTVGTPVSGSERPIDYMYRKEQLPYQTTLGLYNDNNELLAVAKLSNPIQRTVDMPQTFIVRFDT
jgi:hypothetical protein